MPVFGFFLALLLPWHVSAGEYSGTDVLCAIRVIIFCGENSCGIVVVAIVFGVRIRIIRFLVIVHFCRFWFRLNDCSRAFWVRICFVRFG